jgi:hypothetical protein
MTRHEKLWLTIALVIFALAHIVGASKLAAAGGEGAPIGSASTGD